MGGELSTSRAIALAGLLHDIGKLLQRAGEELCSESGRREGYLCPRDDVHNRYTHRHVLWTDHFFSEVIDNELLNEIVGHSTADNVANLALYHHSPSSDLQKIIQSADQLSAKDILLFEVLSQMSEGDDRLGVLKADIDHLGLILTLGLPRDQRTVSPIATLNCMLDWFFVDIIKLQRARMFLGIMRAHCERLLLRVACRGLKQATLLLEVSSLPMRN